ncbi:MAG TPA: CsgG/HfaB family protein [Elusimicrobiales bacterium]|nr:CsgG/HfaB family protein [Elusimicrobiales bacterium]
MSSSFVPRRFPGRAIFIPALTLLLAAAGAINAEAAHRLSVLDFEVQSDNPQYKYLGKGFSEFISIDLSKAKGMALIDREKREAAFKEQAFSLSGAVDEKNGIALGKMLAADYLVTGKIFDMLGDLTVTFKVMSTTNGLVIYEDKVSGKLSKYNYISSKCAEKIVKNFDASLQVAVAAEVDKPEEAVLKFAKAVDSYDKKDFEAAKTDLEDAKKLDPQNAAVKVYMDKLFTTTAKFKVMPEYYVPYENPAYLGLQENRKLFLLGSGASPSENPVTLNDTEGVDEESTRLGVGYSFPIRKGWGASFELANFETKDAVMGWRGQTANRGNNGKNFDFLANYEPSTTGGMLSTGYKVSENVSVGGTLAMFSKKLKYYVSNFRNDGTPNTGNTTRTAAGDYKKESFSASAFTAALMLKNSANTLFLDAYYTNTSQKSAYFKLNEGHFVDYTLPAVQENTLTWLLNQRRTSLVLKQTNYFYSDLDNTSMWKLMPAFEHRFSRLLALRGGVEMTGMKLDSKDSTGTGYIGGLTVNLGKHLEMDANYTSRLRPSRNLEGLSVRENIFFVALSHNGLFSKN